MYYDKVTKFRRVIPNSGGLFDVDDCKTHAVDTVQPWRTVCGVEIGAEKKGWSRRASWAYSIDCTRCLNHIRKEN